jgi:hypothetical protein
MSVPLIHDSALRDRLVARLKEVRLENSHEPMAHAKLQMLSIIPQDLVAPLRQMAHHVIRG